MNFTENQINDFKPTKKWFKNYRITSIDYHVVDTILDSIEEHSLDVIIKCLNDTYFLNTNYPSFSEEEMKEFLYEKYMKKSLLIKNLKKFIKSQYKLLQKNENNRSEGEKDWIEENLYY
jgi:hypothetical protein